VFQTQETSMSPFVAPARDAVAYTCPHCLAYAHQPAAPMYYATGTGTVQMGDLQRNECVFCRHIVLWLGDQMLYPDHPTAPPPNPDLQADIQDDYREAASIVNKSPRGAAALLRLCVQKLCGQLHAEGRNIDEAIGDLVQKGLPVRVQQALDYVRVIGNNAVHPGQIDIKDDRETALTLFGLVNFIAEDLITRPKEVDTMYQSLPESYRNAVGRRDGAATP
jgi:hypothetical protein